MGSRWSGAGRRRLGGALALLAAISLGATGCATPERPDPLERSNRAVFAFNEGLDRYALEPVAKGWDFITPDFVQDGIQNFYRNLDMPVVIANDLLQLKPVRVVEDVARLFFNTTLGLGGFVDVATRVGIPDNDEDFGQTLGRWGVPPGPYLVVPILGPYTLRDGFGEIVDTTGAAYAYMNLFWFDVVGLNGWETTGASIGSYAFRLVNLRTIYLEEIASNRADAFDYYAFVRNAYLQNRSARVLDATDAGVLSEEDLYFDDEEYEDEIDVDETGDDEGIESEEAPVDEVELDESDAPANDEKQGED